MQYTYIRVYMCEYTYIYLIVAHSIHIPPLKIRFVNGIYIRTSIRSSAMLYMTGEGGGGGGVGSSSNIAVQHHECLRIY